MDTNERSYSDHGVFSEPAGYFFPSYDGFSNSYYPR